MKNIIIVLVLGLVSCSKYLDIKPYDKTIPETPEDFSAIIHEMCNEVEQPGSSSVGVRSAMEGSGPFTQECWVDNLETNLTEYPQGSVLPVYVGTQCADGSLYQRLYATIGRSNIIIDNMKGDLGQREAQDILGAAYAFRGVCYYQLLRHYCAPAPWGPEADGVPIVTAFDMEARPARATVSRTIEQAESDLRQALECHISEPLYLFTDDVLLGYLARLYFWAGRYDEARRTAEDVLSRHPLLAGADYEKMMTATDGVAGNMLLRIGRLDKDFQTQNAYLRARPMSARFLRLFAEGERDVRYTLFVGKKRRNEKFLFSGLRSAELALIAMESAYLGGDTQAALDKLNDFRSHRIAQCKPLTMATLPAIPADNIITADAKGEPLTPLLAAIQNERRKELYLENDRFYELKRNGCPEFWVTNKGLKYYTRSFMYTFALPPADIQLNPAIRQNPGYTELEY